MKQVLLVWLVFGALTSEAQYSGRSGFRYINDGSVFTVRRSENWSLDRRDGKCTIRVRIDTDSDVELRGDQLRIRVLQGGPGRDEGSECNAPLPTSGEIRNFRFRGIDGRGNPRLVQQPASSNNYVAVVNVQDPKDGDEGYTFELTWEWDGSGGGLFSGRPTTRPSPQQPGGIFSDQPSTLPATVDPGSLPNMNTSLAGDGTLDDGTQRYNLTDLSVRIMDGQCQISVTTDHRQQFEMKGSMIRNTSRCIINSSNRGKTSGSPYIQTSGTMVTGVNFGGNVNGRNFTGNFQGR